MLKSKIRQSSKFYLDTQASYPNSHLVTDAAHNASLGIKHIALRNSESNKPNAPLFKVALSLNNEMTVFGDIFVNKDGKSLNVSWPQDRFVDANGQAQYINKVTVPLAITCQVLRYAHSMTVESDTGNSQQQPVQQPQAPQNPSAQLPDGFEGYI